MFIINRLLAFQKKQKAGFTYIEVLIATAIFTSIFTILAGLIINAISLKEDSSRLKIAIQLAQTKMDEIRRLKEETSETGDFSSYQGFSFLYEIFEEEKNILEESNLLDDFDIKDEDHQNKIQKKLNKNNKQSQFSALTTIRLWVYKVEIIYKDTKIYNLESYRIRNK